MKSEIRYEWTVEFIDEHGDIVDSEFWDTYEQAMSHAIPDAGCTVDIGVVRDRSTDEEGQVCRSWAYLEDGKLPEYFENAYGRQIAKVPAKFHNEVAA